MLKLLMTPKKALICTREQRIFQRESNVDLLCIYVPVEYDSYDLTQFTASLGYVDAGGNIHTEILEQVESEKEKYMKYVLPITSQFTYVAGDTQLWLTLTNTDPDTQRNYVIKSTKLTITILQQSDYYAYVDESSLASIDRRILELKSISDELAQTTENIPASMPADLELSSQRLQLKNEEGKLLGKGVEISDGGYDGDGDYDGIVDLSETDIDYDPSEDEDTDPTDQDPDSRDDGLIDLDELNKNDESDFSGDTGDSEEEDPDNIGDGIIDLGSL